MSSAIARWLIASLLLSLPACSAPGPGLGAVAPLGDPRARSMALDPQLAAAAQPLRTVQAAGPMDDLAVLDPIVRGARIVGLGEATHGTREVFQLKHRLLAYLVERHGVRVLAFEENSVATREIDRYIKGGPGTPEQALRRAMMVWRTEEIRDMVVWLRSHNQRAAAADRVSVVGVDVQDLSAEAEGILAALERLDPDLARTATPAFALIDDTDAYGSGTDAARDACRDALAAVAAKLRAQAAAVAGPREVARLIFDAETAVKREAGLRAWLEPDGRPGRDAQMAERMQFVADHDFPRAQVALWAHNMHVGVLDDSMGARLRARYDRGYAVLGTAVGLGEVRAVNVDDLRGFTPMPLAPLAPTQLEAALHAVGKPIFALDVRPRSGSEAWRKALLEPTGMSAIGASYSHKKPTRPVTVGAAFDAMLYLDRTQASRMLAAPAP